MKKTISLKIDGKKIFVDQGTTILEAARQNSIHIPTMCYHPRLAPLGHCRMCVVEIEGFNKPVTACDNPAEDGMVVVTKSPRLKEIRAGILELALGTHPFEDCLTCVRTGSCELQEDAYYYQVNLPRQFDRDIITGQVEDNPYIVRDHEKCILCGRCIEACRVLAGRSVFSIVGRGVNSMVAPVKDGQVVSMEEAGCIFCGQCVDVCPVAALTEKDRHTAGREWELESAEGICNDCSLCCYLERYVSKEKLVKVSVPVEGDKTAWLCQKGRFGFIEELEAYKEATPLKYAKGKYAELGYKEALHEAGTKIKEITQAYGAQSVALVASGGLSNEESFMLQKMARSVIGTENINLGAEELWVKAFTSAMQVTGLGIAGPDPGDIGAAEGIFVIGGGLEESHPVAHMAVGQAARFGRAEVVFLAEEASGDEAFKALHLEARPGEYAKLFAKIKDVNSKAAPAKSAVEEIWPASKLEKAAEVMRLTGGITIVTPEFFAQAGEEALFALLSLLEETGQLAKGKSKVMFLPRFSNACGVLLTGGTSWYNPGLLKREAEEHHSQESLLEAAQAGKFKAIILFGDEYKELKLPYDLYAVVVASSFEKAPAGTKIFIPAQPLPCKKGYFTNSSGRTRVNRDALRAEDLRFEDWRTIAGMAASIGSRWGYETIEDVRLEMKSVTPAE